MGKKECLCEDGKASHDALYERFLKEVVVDHGGDLDKVKKAIELLKIEPLTKSIDARDLENILHFICYNEEVAIDEGTILLLVCSCKRNSWQTNEGIVDEDEPYEDYVEGPRCEEHLVCVVGGERNIIVDNFIEMITDDSC